MIEQPTDWNAAAENGSNRQKDRDSLFLLADIMVDGNEEPIRARVRNLSPGGMMVECDLQAEKGTELTAFLRNIGKIKGRIAWVNGGRFGIAFNKEIDPKLARKPAIEGEKTPRFARPIAQKIIRNFR